MLKNVYKPKVYIQDFTVFEITSRVVIYLDLFETADKAKQRYLNIFDCRGCHFTVETRSAFLKLRYLFFSNYSINVSVEYTNLLLDQPFLNSLVVIQSWLLERKLDA